MAATEGQHVMALVSKRLRTHRKKYNRITEMEESISQGKTLDKEQKETILSKPIARKEVPPEEKDVTSKTDMEDCKVSDEVSKDDISPCSESSQDVTPSPPSTSSGKARRKKKSKIPQTTN
ncbi:hypothetical protein HID58_010633 [Brassica napus]|uniref:Uncharacterized protein n=1 Tax=Brassica napus TaxID=3708 RepID=A0ABQ8DYK7_BRANA|nr:hypothetical protein HID58_010633 [Brassica napus]